METTSTPTHLHITQTTLAPAAAPAAPAAAPDAAPAAAPPAASAIIVPMTMAATTVPAAMN